jgi:hypothetical protein
MLIETWPLPGVLTCAHRSTPERWGRLYVDHSEVVESHSYIKRCLGLHAPIGSLSFKLHGAVLNVVSPGTTS